MLGDLFGKPPEQVKSLLWDSGFSADCDAGKYPTAADVRAEVRKLTGYSGTDDDLDTAWCSAFHPAAEVVEAIAKANAVAGVFTNNGPLEEEVLTRLHPGAFAPFAHLFFCPRLVANKPDLAVYEQVSTMLALPAQQIRFVDDGTDNVEAARQAGWTAVQYHNVADLEPLIG